MKPTCNSRYEDISYQNGKGYRSEETSSPSYSYCSASSSSQAAATTTCSVVSESNHSITSNSIRGNRFSSCCGGGCTTINSRLPFFQDNQEALGYALDSMARATVFCSWGAFFLPMLQELATLAAECSTTTTTNTIECTGRIHGIRPSSLLTALLTLVGLISACLAPVIGAWVDTTYYRQTLGRGISTLLCIGMIPTLGLQPNNWSLMAMLFILLSFGFWIHTLLSYSYLPELTKDPATLNDYTRGISLCTFMGMVFFLITMVGLAATFQWNDLTVAHVSQSLTLLLFAVSTYISWGQCFQPRPPAHPPLPGHGLCTAGFAQLSSTLRKLHHQYPALRCYYLAEGISNPAIGAMLVIQMTFLADVLQFTSQQVGMIVLLMLLSCIPGAILSSALTDYQICNPLQTVIGSLVWMMGVVTLTSFILTGPEVGMYAYPLAAAWGIGMGCNFTCDRVVIASLLPPGQDSELMGLYLFTGQALNWFPPLIYTALNELGYSPNLGVATLNVFLGLGVVGFVSMGSFHDAVAAAGSSTTTTGVQQYEYRSNKVNNIPNPQQPKLGPADSIYNTEETGLL